MHAFWQDLRYELRALTRARSFTTVVVGILAVGLGATTALFSAVDSVLLRSLPYRDADRLIALRQFNVGQRVDRAGFSATGFLEVRNIARTLDGVAAFRPWGFVLTSSGSDDPERVSGARVSANLPSLLGITPLLGREFIPEEEQRGNDHVVLLSEQFWRRRFGGDPRAVGRTVRLDGQSFLIVGVLPARYALPFADIWVPLAFAPYEISQNGSRSLSVVARLEPGVSLAAVHEEMSDIARNLAARFPDANAGWEIAAGSLRDEVVGNTRAPLLFLLGAAGVVLLVGCANIVVLMLARGATRQRTIAIRFALGATRRLILRHLVLETSLIASAATILGVGLAVLGSRALGALGAPMLPRGTTIHFSGATAAFLLPLAWLCSLVLTLLPARAALRFDPSQLTSAPFAARRNRAIDMRDVLVVGQVALSVLLLVGAGLLVRSFVRVQAVDLGFSAAGVLTMSVSVPDSRYGDPERRVAFFGDLQERAASHRGVRAAGFASHIPLAGERLNSDFRIEPSANAGAGRSRLDLARAQLASVTPRYFDALGIGVVRGRSFDATDRVGSRPVVVIDEALAARYFPGDNPVGRRVQIGTTMGADTAWREIVGIVRSVRASNVVRPPEPTLYVPHAQNPWPTMTLAVRVDGSLSGYSGLLRDDLRVLDRGLPVPTVRTLGEIVERTLSLRRLQTLLLAGFAATTLVLAVSGLYGTIAYVVEQQSREIGIRVAVGARQTDVIRLVLGRALKRLTIGTFLGVTGSIVWGRVLATALFEVSPRDPGVITGAVGLLAAAGMLAAYVPALRATRIDPMVALRSD